MNSFNFSPNNFTYSTKKAICQTEVDIIKMVDEFNGLIHGSMIHKLVATRTGELVGDIYRPSDIDILFPTEKQCFDFITMVRTYLQKADVKFESRWGYPYRFSEFIKSTYNNNSVSYKNANNEWINITAQSVDTSSANVDCTQNVENFMKFCSEQVLKLDFLKNFYFKGKVYHKLKSVMGVTLPNFKYPQHTAAVIRKYGRRGVMFTLIDTSDSLKPALKDFIKFKKHYFTHGLVTIPLSRNDNEGAGKAPSVKDWANLTTEYDFYPKYCDNIGILCGPASGIVCVDVDVKDDGLKMFNKMKEIYGIPENCPVQCTGNGGYHYIFKYDSFRMQHMTKKIKAPKLDGLSIGIDLWISNCQFVAEPSVNYSNGGKYTWIRPITSAAEIPALPEWIYDLYHKEEIDSTGRIVGGTFTQNAVNVPPTITKTTTETTVTEEEYITDDDSEDSSEASSDSSSDSDDSECGVCPDCVEDVHNEISFNLLWIKNMCKDIPIQYLVMIGLAFLAFAFMAMFTTLAIIGAVLYYKPELIKKFKLKVVTKLLALIVKALQFFK